MPLKILTVDDSNTIRMIVKRAFKPYDCEILEAEDGLKGLEKMRGEKPDLVLLDVDMPVMGGVEALKKIRDDPEINNIPIIMLTAEADKKMVVSIMKMGVKGYVVKPFNINELAQRVQTAVTLVPLEDNEQNDVARKYFKIVSNTTVLNVPGDLSKIQRTQLYDQLPGELEKAVGKEMGGMVLNLRSIRAVNVQVVKLILNILEECNRINLPCRIVAKNDLSEQLKEVEETSGISFFHAVVDALSDLSEASPS